jgi:alcohol dehydrogenase class IV
MLAVLSNAWVRPALGSATARFFGAVTMRHCMQSFAYTALPSRVIFGFGTIARTSEEVRALGASRALVLSTSGRGGQAQALGRSLGPLCVGVFSGAVMHAPVEATEHALEVVRESRADCTVALGGGSAIGLGKSIAFVTDLPQIVLPTTYSGSEATSIGGETKAGVKTTLKSPKVLPEVIIYDVELTYPLPPSVSVVSGFNAIAHAVEALYAREANPLISLLAEEGIQALARALPAVRRNPVDSDARAEALYGAWLCGICLGSVGMALHHKLCHVVGGAFNLPHAETHTVLLPHATAYNAKAAPEAMSRIARALRAADAVDGLSSLARALDAPKSLRGLGMPEEGISHAVDLAMASPYWNPQALERKAIRELITRAWSGAAPQ